MKNTAHILKLDHQGRGIIKENNKIIFIDKAIPGEIVNYEIVNEKSKYSEAKVLSYEKEINRQKNYTCKYYYLCGGCQISKLSYEEQLLFKKEKVENILKKYCNIDKKINIIPSDQKLAYRNKVTFHVLNGKIGYYQLKTNKLIEIDKCLLIDNTVNNILKIIKSNIDLKDVSKITIRHTNYDIMLIFYGKIVKDRAIELLKNYVTSIYVYDDKYEKIYGKNKIIEQLSDLLFYVSADSFFQINTNVALKLYNKILDYADVKKEDKIIDLYCGTGTIGLYLARHVKEVFGVEINKNAILDAIDNAKLNKINNIKFTCENTNNLNNLDADIIIVDPPRNGLDRKTKDLLLKAKSRKIIYVSCNPMTLARDINDLSNNYEFTDITLFDMFCQDYHVESISLFTRKEK